MKSMIVAIACALSALAACKQDDRIAIIVRPCVVRGALWTMEQSGKPTSQDWSPTADARVAAAVDKASKIWERDANLAFIIIPLNTNDGHIPIIEDPFPPRSPLDVAFHGPGKLGDVMQQYDRATEESEAAAASCDRVWQEQFPDGPPGIPIVFVSRFVREDGVKTTQRLGLGPALFTVYARNDGHDLCDRPYSLQASDVRNRWILVSVPSNLVEDSSLHQVVAHEVGHALLLQHGDGVDNNGSGRWDSGCDYPGENAIEAILPYDDRSLMDPSAKVETITDLQRELARQAAMLVPGTLGGPP
jgi:hypothetical protein